MEIKITKRTKLYEIHNSMVSNYYYLVNGRIINDDNTKYRKFRFVAFFDGCDLWEAEIENPLEYLDEIIPTYTDYIKSFDDCKEFYELCNDTIEHYNK